MNVLVTGSSSGIGRECALLFLEKGYDVYGIDVKEDTIKHPHYTHFSQDVREKANLPAIDDISILVTSAGEDAVELGGEEVGRDLQNAADAGGVLRGQCGDRAHGVNAVGRHYLGCRTAPMIFPSI